MTAQMPLYQMFEGETFILFNPGEDELNEAIFGTNPGERADSA